jgi:hypothetical protein
MRASFVLWLILLFQLLGLPLPAAAATIIAPDASGSIRADGTLAFGPHGIAATSWNAASLRYEITFEDHDYGAADVTVVNLLGDGGSCPGGATARVAHLAGKLLVFVIDAAGNNIDCSFALTSFFGSSRAGIAAPLDNAFAPHAPMAIGSIQRGGGIGSGAFGIQASTWNATLLRYEIDLVGMSFSIADVPAVALTGDTANCPAGAVIRHGSVSGKLLVYVIDAAGTQIQCPFQFFAYPAALDYLLLSDGFEGDAEAGARIPGAYGYVNQFAVADVQHAHGVDSALWNSTLERYEIALEAFAFGISDRAVVSISGGTGSCPAGAVARSTSVSGLLLIYIVEADGDRRQCSFRFVAQDG